MRTPVRVAVTGAAGQIGYNLVFRIASGAMLGADQPIILQLLDLPQAMKGLEGVAMELNDCAFPLLQGVEISDNPKTAFNGCDYALLVGARPRSAGMERADLLSANANIFKEQGTALNAVAKPEIKILVVGNPANTNAMITQHFARDIPKEQIHAMMRLDHNRALYQIAHKLETPVRAVRNVTIWGNHSANQYPDLFHAKAQNKSVAEQVSHDWIENTFIPTVQKRGAAVIEARGASSAASAANAAIDHIRDWVMGTPADTWVSMGVPSDGSYGIAPGVVFGYPCYCHDGKYKIVPNLSLDDFSRARIDKSHKELLEEKDAIKSLLV